MLLHLSASICNRVFQIGSRYRQMSTKFPEDISYQNIIQMQTNYSYLHNVTIKLRYNALYIECSKY